jgi:flagellar assembly factor FliW
MLINTRDFGEVEIADESIITFPAGVFAFEDAKNFALLSPLGEDTYPMWLQSVDDLAPCFIVFDPGVVDEGYFETVIDCVELNDARLLKIEDGSVDKKDIAVLTIATVPDDFKKTTLNMKAPIVVNTTCNLAAQVILTADYDFRCPLYAQDAQIPSEEVE